MHLSRRITVALLAGALILGLSSTSFAQQGQRRGGRGGGRISAILLNRLNLNDEQKAKIKTATDTFEAEQEKSRALGTPQERRQANRAARQTYVSSINATLNDDQRKKLESLLAEARDYRALGGVGAQLAGLNLTAEQKTKVQAIAAKYQPDLMKLRESQRSGADRQTVRAQTRELQTKMMGEVRAVLTPDQQKQLPQARGRRNQ
jgi:Spy/CpxP family protein refolding chaperone